jgi:hypothetical protein
MSARFIRAILLIAVAALLGNARCIDDCSATGPVPSKAPAANCPLHKSTGGHPANCERQHPQFATAATAKIQLDRQPLVGYSLNFTPQQFLQIAAHQTLLLRRNETPPARNPQARVTVLRI